MHDSGQPDQTTTSYIYDSQHRLTSVREPYGTLVQYGYNANGQRTSFIVTPPGGGTASVVNDYYQLGHLGNQTDGNGTLLASYTYDSTGAPVSVQVGSDPSSAPRYYYVYNAHGDVVRLVDATGATVASYSYDTWGNPTSASEHIPNANGWTNPYRYDGRDGVRSDAADGLDWLAARAYDPSTSRFISRDPLGRAPLYFADNPYIYAGNNPLSNVDPSGQYRAAGHGSAVRESGSATNHMMARVQAVSGCDAPCQRERARGIATAAAAYFAGQLKWLPGSLLHSLASVLDPGLILGLVSTPAAVPSILKTLAKTLQDDAELTGQGLLGVLGAAAAMASVMYTGALMDFVLNDMVASAYQYMFALEATASKAFWLSSDSLGFDYAKMVGVSMLGSFLTLGFAGIMAVLVSDGAPFWAVTALATIALIMNNLQHYAETFIDQEEAVFGYGPS